MRSNNDSKSSKPNPQSERNDRTSSNRSSTLRFHRVSHGETLTQIAEQYYGDETFWILLYGCNEPSIRTAGGLCPGQTLYIPFM